MVLQEFVLRASSHQRIDEIVGIDVFAALFLWKPWFLGFNMLGFPGVSSPCFGINGHGIMLTPD